MKNYLILLLSIFLIGCGEENLITKTSKPSCYGVNNCRDYYVVMEAHNKNNGLCKYYLSTDGWVDYKWNIEFIDSIGKYQIGQHLYSTFEPVN